MAEKVTIQFSSIADQGQGEDIIVSGAPIELFTSVNSINDLQSIQGLPTDRDIIVYVRNVINSNTRQQSAFYKHDHDTNEWREVLLGSHSHENKEILDQIGNIDASNLPYDENKILTLKKEDIDLIEEKLVERSIQIRSEIKALKSTQDAVDRTIKSIERYRKSPLPGTLSLEFIERRRILYIQSPIDFYCYGIEKYEECIRNLRLKLVGMNISQVLSYSLCTSVNKDDFMEGKLVADKIFIFGDKRLSEYSDDTLLLESGMYACVYLDNYDNEKKEAERLLKFALDNGYEIAGDYICEEMTELNFLQKRQRNMFLRLQVPVIFSK